MILFNLFNNTLNITECVDNYLYNVKQTQKKAYEPIN